VRDRPGQPRLGTSRRAGLTGYLYSALVAGSVAEGTGGTSDCLARYRGTVVVRLRSYTYHGKGTVGGEMAIYEDHLEFRGVGFHSWELHKYEIARERVGTILPRSAPGKPWFPPKFITRRYGIRVVSKAAGAFGDRDEYRFEFDSPASEEVLGTLRAAGYPVPVPNGH